MHSNSWRRDEGRLRATPSRSLPRSYSESRRPTRASSSTESERPMSNRSIQSIGSTSFPKGTKKKNYHPTHITANKRSAEVPFLSFRPSRPKPRIEYLNAVPTGHGGALNCMASTLCQIGEHFIFVRFDGDPSKPDDLKSYAAFLKAGYKQWGFLAFTKGQVNGSRGCIMALKTLVDPFENGFWASIYECFKICQVRWTVVQLYS
ncbi:hypothetical protein BC829DRAFT_64552 [Chytridium lagenaria]|nr:hypothetical protein BC829DRAFT_64552 [Chytridium lagenaria]